jgi:hypothetical protein
MRWAPVAEVSNFGRERPPRTLRRPHSLHLKAEDGIFGHAGTIGATSHCSLGTADMAPAGSEAEGGS